MSVDLNPLLKLKEDLLQIQANTLSMKTKVSLFQERLSTIDTKMSVVQEATDSLALAKKNIGNAILEIERTHEYFRISSNCQSVINVGLQGHYTEFFEAIEKLSDARRFFHANREIKSSGSAIYNIDGLLKRALNMCIVEVKHIFGSCGDTLNYTGTRYQGGSPIDDELQARIHDLSSVLNKNNEYGYFEVYMETRIQYMKSKIDALLSELGITLESLMGNVMKAAFGIYLGDGKRSQAIQTPLGRANTACSYDVPFAPGMNPLHEVLSMMLELLRGEKELWHSSFPHDTSEECLKSLAAICSYISSEFVRIFSVTLKDNQKLASGSASGVLLECNLLLMRMSLVDIMIRKFPEFRDLMAIPSVSDNKALKGMDEFRKSLLAATLRSCNDLLEHIILGMGPLSAGQETCDIHPISGHVLRCCKDLTPLLPVYAQVYVSAKELDLPKTLYAKLPSGGGEFIVEMLNNLVKCLQAKASSFLGVVKAKSAPNSPPSWYQNVGSHSLFDAGEKEAKERLALAKPYLFLINNLYAIRVYLNEIGFSRSSRRVIATKAGEESQKQVQDAAALLSADTVAQLTSYYNTVNEQLTDDIDKFTIAIMRTLAMAPEDIAFAHQLDADKTKKFALLKTMYSAFNAGVAVLQAQQPDWRLNYSELRDELDALLLQRILPVYTEFYEETSKIKFSSKHMDQYLRYKPSDVETRLSGYFKRGK